VDEASVCFAVVGALLRYSFRAVTLPGGRNEGHTTGKISVPLIFKGSLLEQVEEENLRGKTKKCRFTNFHLNPG